MGGIRAEFWRTNSASFISPEPMTKFAVADRTKTDDRKAPCRAALRQTLLLWSKTCD